MGLNKLSDFMKNEWLIRELLSSAVDVCYGYYFQLQPSAFLPGFREYLGHQPFLPSIHKITALFESNYLKLTV